MSKKDKKNKKVETVEQEGTTSENNEKKVVQFTNPEAIRIEEAAEETRNLVKDVPSEFVQKRLLRTAKHLHKVAIKVQKNEDNKNKPVREKKEKENKKEKAKKLEQLLDEGADTKEKIK